MKQELKITEYTGARIAEYYSLVTMVDDQWVFSQLMYFHNELTGYTLTWKHNWSTIL